MIGNAKWQSKQEGHQLLSEMWEVNKIPLEHFFYNQFSDTFHAHRVAEWLDPLLRTGACFYKKDVVTSLGYGTCSEALLW